ncbi:class I SAM-dependent methyltransferase [Kitasatospora sp. NPDC053057]|uniref:class I SAM-dependent methyltransferase n=1 Tax=Kitasatospora sp. NPDC053057 TaxID=3364062 RepID=UPI0037C942DB
MLLRTGRPAGPLRTVPRPAAALLPRPTVEPLPHGADLLDYLRAARTTGGPVLDLGAGSGRFAVPLARQGFDVDAVDRDPARLARLRTWAGTLPGTHPGRVTTIRAELAELTLHRRYGLVMMAGGLILELPEHVRPVLLREIAAHLTRDGVLALDWISPDAPGAAPGATAPCDLRGCGLRTLRRDRRPLGGGRSSTFLLCGRRD